ASRRGGRRGLLRAAHHDPGDRPAPGQPGPAQRQAELGRKGLPYSASSREIASRPLGVSTTRIDTAWPSARCARRARVSTEMWTNTSLPPSDTATKPKPLSPLNHLTVPVISTAVDGSGAMRGPRGAPRGPPPP